MATERLMILLGSKSPRRQQLLKEMGFAYKLVHQDVEETYHSDLPVEEIAEYLAKKKAAAILEHHPPLSAEEVILTCDTVVLLNGKSYGKPVDSDDARRILAELSGQTHIVMTGVCLTSPHKQITFSDTTRVTFANLSHSEIEYYIHHYHPFDKAGSYAIQEWIGLNKITRIEGSYYNVVGLPTSRLYSELVLFADSIPNPFC